MSHSALTLFVALSVLALHPAAGRCTQASAEEHPNDPADHASDSDHDAPHSSRLTDEEIPLQLDGFPQRPGFLIELGNPYLGTGNIKKGYRLPTGAIWQPTLIAFGSLRTAVQSFERPAPAPGPTADDTRITEAAVRLDLFFNLQLSGTERLVVGFRPLDTDGLFTSYIFEPTPADGDRTREEFDGDLETLYFEGDFGEIFPNLDRDDFGRSDIGFSIGRQPLLFQEGMLIGDSVDGVGLTRNTLLPKGTSNYRMTFFAGVDNVHRHSGTAATNAEDPDAELYALLTSTDFRRSTVDIDLAYVTGGPTTGDLVAVGLSAVQRIGRFNTSFRLLGSSAVDDETPVSTDGFLAFSEVSWTPHHSHDLVYFTAFVGVDEYSPAASGPSSGGPLGRAGIGFAAVGLGSYGAPLSNRSREVAGGAFGYQRFFGPLNRRQLVAELGTRVGTVSTVPSAAAATARYQMAFGRRTVVVVDGFAARQETLDGRSDETRLGGRLELLVKF